jgi:mRNA-degrading endonuclease RelE of RelBE toxin-antitoxin system
LALADFHNLPGSFSAAIDKTIPSPPNNPLDRYTLKTYIGIMHTFIELHSFASARDKYLDDDEFTAFQLYLADRPDAGDVIPRSGGCRKLRWAIEGRGKRGGVRVIYFLRLNSGQIVLVTMYSKNVQEDIDPNLLKRLKEGFENG